MVAIARSKLPVLALIALLLNLGAGIFIKARCFSIPWNEPGFLQFGQMCYSDLISLYLGQHWDQGGIPYARRLGPEYPPLIAVQQWAASRANPDMWGFFLSNALVNAGWACLAFWALQRLTGPSRRLFLFSATPPVLFYAAMNWDLSSVAAVALAAVAWKQLSNRYFWTAFASGVGTCGKIYPLFIMPPLLLRAFDEKKGRGNALLAALSGFALGWGIFNLPAMVADLQGNGDARGWLEMFTYHEARDPVVHTVWYWLTSWSGALVPGSAVDLISLTLFTVGCLAVLTLQRKRGVDPWRATLAITALFLAVSKLYSLQYALWLIPFLVIIPLPRSLLVAFFTVDVLFAVTYFQWLQASRIQPEPGLAITASLAFLVFARTAVDLAVVFHSTADR